MPIIGQIELTGNKIKKYNGSRNYGDNREYIYTEIIGLESDEIYKVPTSQGNYHITVVISCHPLQKTFSTVSFRRISEAKEFLQYIKNQLQL